MTRKTTEEEKNELMENWLLDNAKSDMAYKKRNMRLAVGCHESDYYMDKLKKLEPNKSYSQIVTDFEKFAQRKGN